MADDPYKQFGLPRTATDDEIRTAYRKLAKASHPDLHPGDKGAEDRFKALNAANDLLSDPVKRAQFDRGEIDPDGQPVAPSPQERAYYRDYAQSQAGARYTQGAGPDFEGLFGTFARDQARRPRRGRDRSYRLDVPFLDTVNGATERLTLPGGDTLDVRIPPGLQDGQVLRLRGKGEPGLLGGPDGDALVEVSVFPHPTYRREGNDLVMDLPVTFAEAILGGRIEVPTPRGRVMLAVPPRSDAGTRMRLRGRGVAAHGEVPAGDLYVVLKLVLGQVDTALEEFLKPWAENHPADSVRADLESGA